MNLWVERIHNGQASHLTSRTRLMRKQEPKFRVQFTHCGTDWWWNCVTKPDSMRCMCQTCGAFGVGRLQEIKEES